MLPRVAVDANVLIAGFGWPRWPYEVLQHAIEGDYQLVLSPVVIAEAKYRIGLHLPERVELFELFLLAIDYELAPVPSKDEVKVNSTLMRDIKDVPIALSIMQAEVDYFVTYDRDFTDQNETTAKVRKAIPGIMLPPVFLRDVMNWTSEQLEEIRGRQWSDMEEFN